jgi:phage-related holin
VYLQKERETMLKNGLGAVAGFAVAMVGTPLPSEAVQMIEVVTVLVALDTLTGVWLAIVERRLSSREAFVRLVSKLAQFTIFFTLAFTMATLTHQWAIVSGALFGLIGLEGLSLVDKMQRLERYGVPLGPLRPIIRRLSRYFESLEAAKKTKPEEEAEGGDKGDDDGGRGGGNAAGGSGVFASPAEDDSGDGGRGEPAHIY